MHKVFWNLLKPKLLLVSDPDWLTQTLSYFYSTEPACIIIFRSLCNCPNEKFCDVTLARRFRRGKQMIACEWTRFCAVVLVGCFISLSRLGSLAFSMRQKHACVTASSDPGLHRIWCFTENSRSASQTTTRSRHYSERGHARPYEVVNTHAEMRAEKRIQH